MHLNKVNINSYLKSLYKILIGKINQTNKRIKNIIGDIHVILLKCILY
jgi:hypothetical protein